MLFTFAHNILMCDLFACKTAPSVSEISINNHFSAYFTRFLTSQTICVRIIFSLNHITQDLPHFHSTYTPSGHRKKTHSSYAIDTCNHFVIIIAHHRRRRRRRQCLVPSRSDRIGTETRQPTRARCQRLVTSPKRELP